MSDYLSNLDPANLANVVRQLAIDVAELKGRTVNAQTLDEFTNDMGLQTAGEFRSGNGAEPGDGFTGGRFGYPGFEYDGAYWFLVGVNDDRMMVGIDLETGKLLAAGGAMTIDDTGINLNGIRYALRHYAEDVEGNNPRYGRFEMFYPGIKTTPALGLSFQDADDGPELLGENRGFELGDLTSWDADEGWEIVDENVYSGAYAAKCVTTSESKQLISEEFEVIEGKFYQISLIGQNSSSGSLHSYITWLNEFGDEISTEIIYIFPELMKWPIGQKVSQAPEGAEAAKILILAGINSVVYVDSVSVSQVGEGMRRLFFDPDLKYQDAESVKRVVSSKLSLHKPRPPITALVTTSTGNVTWGEHTYKVTFVDASGETIGSAASNWVTNDTTHRQSTVIIPTGPSGTTSRKIYRTKAGEYSYFLLAIVADNSTVSYTDNIADADLGVAEPVVNLSENNPIFPTSSKITGGQFLKYPDIAYGWLAIAGYAMGGVAVDSGMGMQFDTYKAGFLLKAGSYKVILHLGKAANAGIVDIYLDGVLVQAAVDLYAAAAAAYVLTPNKSIEIYEDGWHELELVVVGKNASSTGYDVRISMVEIAPVSTLTTYRSQPDETDGIDSYIRQSLATTNFGTETTMLIGWGSSTSTILRGLLKFDLTKGTNPPTAGAIVVGTPRMKLNCTSFTTAKTLAAYASLRDWVEAQVTWNIFSTGNNWQTAGAAGALDYDPTLLGSVEVSASGYIIMPLPVSLIQGWIDVANYGLILRHTVETTNFNQYATASHATAAFRPELLFEWR